MGVMDGRSRDIFALFLSSRELAFADIERSTGIRSNLLAYHLRQMVCDGVLEKDGLLYRLTKRAETLIPYFQQLTGGEQLKLPVVVLALRRSDGCFGLVMRSKRPYQGYWAVPGSKWRMEESIEEAARRIAAEECGITAGDIRVCAVIDEHLADEAGLRNSWVMFLVHVGAGAQLGRDINWVSVDDLDGIRIIPSDAWMLRELVSERMQVRHVRMREMEQYAHAFSE